MNCVLLPTLARCLKVKAAWAELLGKADRQLQVQPGLSAQIHAAFGLPTPDALPWATLLADDEGIDTHSGRWLALEALSLRVAPNGVYVVASNDFGQSDADMRALWDSIAGLLEDEQFVLHRGRGHRAFLQLSDAHTDPATISAEDLLGAELTPWFPAQREWRRRLNEFQIVWSQHPLNQARLQQRMLPINSPWLGRCAVSTTTPATRPSAICSADPLLHAVARWAQVPLCDATEEIAANAVLDLREDPSRAHELVLRSRGGLALNFACGARFALRRWHRWRFWRAAEPTEHGAEPRP